MFDRGNCFEIISKKDKVEKLNPIYGGKNEKDESERFYPG